MYATKSYEYLIAKFLCIFETLIHFREYYLKEWDGEGS